MKVFISWSGERSREVANVLRDWISCVLQAVKPWVSTRDIDRGSLWFSEISGQLQEAAVGIICLTQQNKTQPWILFEAGALAKGLTTARVCTLLVDLSPGDVKDPLAQFNHTMPDEQGIRSLMVTLNSALGASRLEDKVLDQVFEIYWPRFKKLFDEALLATPEGVPDAPQDPSDTLSEVLELVKTVSGRMARIEQAERLRTEIAMRPETSFALNSEELAVRDASSRRKATKIARTMLMRGMDPEAVVMSIIGVVSPKASRDIVSMLQVELGMSGANSDLEPSAT